MSSFIPGEMALWCLNTTKGIISFGLLLAQSTNPQAPKRRFLSTGNIDLSPQAL